MGENHTKPVSKRDKKREDSIRNKHIYKEVAINAIKNVTEFDTKVIESNDEYLEKLRQADSSEYEILKINMEKAESNEERQAIRDRMAEMKKERYEKDSENKEFYEKQQREHKNFNLQVLGSVAFVTGLVIKYRKPIMNMGKKLLIRKSNREFRWANIIE